MMARYGMLVNTKKCIGCYACRTACQRQNDLLPDESFIRFEEREVGKYPNVTVEHIPLQCMHCEDAPCASVCPTGAAHMGSDGIVEVDHGRCIGCLYCMAACPYNARVFNWSEPERDPNWNYGDKDVPVRPKGVAEKCTLCKERTDDGDVPMCVRVCPARARTFGDLDDPESDISKLARERVGDVHHLLEEKGTRPQLFYIG
mgnify:CR=1 FL=1